MTGAYHSKRGPAEGCPVSETPIRDRAWTDEQRLAYIGKHGLDNQRYSNHVLRVGGDGDLSDISTFIDAAIAAGATS